MRGREMREKLVLRDTKDGVSLLVDGVELKSVTSLAYRTSVDRSIIEIDVTLIFPRDQVKVLIES